MLTKNKMNGSDAITGSIVDRYYETGENDEKYTVQQFIENAKTMQRTLMSVMTTVEFCIILDDLSCNAILWNAYQNAFLAWNNGPASTDMIPSSKCIWYHLRKLIIRYIYAGVIFDECWLNVIFNKSLNDSIVEERRTVW